MSAPKFAWTPAALETVRRMWSEGYPASQIAAAIGTTRSAVLGKSHYLGLAPRAPALAGEAQGRRDKIAEMIRNGSGLREAARAVGASIHTVRAVARSIAADAVAEPRQPDPVRAIRLLPPIARSGMTGPGEGVGMLDIARSQCAWQLWPDTGRPTFRCCGAPSSPGRPYCAEHAARAYRRVEVPSEQVAA